MKEPKLLVPSAKTKSLEEKQTLGPIPSPKTNLATNNWGQEYVKASQMDAAPAIKQDQNMTPRLPTQRLKGSVIQQANTA